LARSSTVTVAAEAPVELQEGSYELRYHLPEWTGVLAEIAAWFKNAFEPIVNAKFVRAYTQVREKERIEALWNERPEVIYIAERHVDLVLEFRVQPASPVAVPLSVLVALALAALIIVGLVYLTITIGPAAVGVGIGLLILLLLMMIGAAPERREER